MESDNGEKENSIMMSMLLKKDSMRGGAGWKFVAERKQLSHPMITTPLTTSDKRKSIRRFVFVSID
jgi:hypothetical protein